MRTTTRCPYCGNAASEAQICINTNGGFACTRPPGHRGDHVACGSDSHRMRAWNDKGVVTFDPRKVNA